MRDAMLKLSFFLFRASILVIILSMFVWLFSDDFVYIYTILPHDISTALRYLFVGFITLLFYFYGGDL